MRRHDAQLISLNAQRRAEAMAERVGSDSTEKEMVGVAAQYGAFYALTIAGVIDDD